jgi:hypothetical protein
MNYGGETRDVASNLGYSVENEASADLVGTEVELGVAIHCLPV